MSDHTPDPTRDAPAGGATSATAGSVVTSDGVPTKARGDRAQYGMCAFLAVLGGLLLVDAARIGHATSSNDPVVPVPCRSSSASCCS